MTPRLAPVRLPFLADVDRWLADTEDTPDAVAPRSVLVELRATIRGLEAERDDALSEVGRLTVDVFHFETENARLRAIEVAARRIMQLTTIPGGRWPVIGGENWRELRDALA